MDCCSTGSLVEFESASMLHGSSSTEGDACSSIKKLPKSCSVHEEQAKPEPILVSTCMPAETSKTVEDKPKTRRITKIKPCAIHKSGKQFPDTQDVSNGREDPLKKSRKCDEAYQISTQTKTAIRGSSDESANLKPFRASTSVFSKTPATEDDLFSGVENQQTTRNAEMLASCRKGKQFQNLGHVQNAPEKSLKQSNGRRGNNGEKPKPKQIVQALAAACIATDTPKIEEDKPETGRIVEMKALKLHEKGKQLPNSEDVENEAEKSLQRSNRQQTTRNAELLLRCGKGKQFDLEHFQKAPEKSLKQITGERVSDGELVQGKPKPSNRDKEAIELRLKATKRKLHERYEQAQNARKKIQVVEFIDLPQTATTCAKTHRAKDHIRSQKAYVGQATPEPILVSTCMPAETSKSEEDKPKPRRIIKMKPYTIHKSGKQFPDTEDVRNGPEDPLKKSIKCDEAYQISTQTKTPIRGSSDESANPKPFRASASVFSKTPATEDDLFSGVENQQTTRNAKMLASCRKGKQFQNLGHVQNAPEKSLKQSTGRRVNNGETVQEKPKPNHIVPALATACIATDTPKIEEDKLETRRIVEMKALKLHEKGKQLPNSEDVQNEVGKSLQRSNRQQTTRNAELLLRCGKGKQLDLGHFQKAPEKSLKQSTGERVSDGGLVQEKTKPSNRDEEAIELKLKGTKRKLHERYEQAQNARKKIQVVEFIDLPQTATTCAKTQRAKEHMRSQKAYVGRFMQ